MNKTCRTLTLLTDSNSNLKTISFIYSSIGTLSEIQVHHPQPDVWVEQGYEPKAIV